MELAELTDAMHQFVEAMGWYAPDSPKPQSPRNLAISLVIEAAEVMELFQWKDKRPDDEALASELADVMLYLLQLASLSNIDLEQAVMDKLRTNYDRDW
ncbi:MAG: nucleotide pyrophosphohydrolase [Anaerolineales bacterium]|nr:nucleotide pyrophosphohydrolase [Anaerolineales bacterium]